MAKEPLKLDKEGLPVTVAILHPDLGIGGAESLIINVGLALETKGYTVKVFTPFFDPNRCLEEAKRLNVEVRGSIVPRAIFGRFFAFCAYLRMLLCAFHVIGFAGRFDYIILDQVSLPIPFLRYLTTSKIIFYCHYPDKLLCKDRTSTLKKAYRLLLDWIEDRTTLMADLLLVNSEFTKKTLINESKRASREREKWEKNIEILNPPIMLQEFDRDIDEKQVFNSDIGFLKDKFSQNKLFVLTSLNRYERKKNHGLAVEAFALALNDLEKENKEPILIIAGGYDTRVEENVEHLEELRAKAKEYGLVEKKNILFLKSVSNETRNYLLRKSDIVLYTPENEHFGIVPLEAMYNQAIVIACNSGGPLETIKNGKTGFTLNPDSKEWAKKIKEVALDKGMKHIGKAAKDHVTGIYTLDVFADRLDASLQSFDKKTQ